MKRTAEEWRRYFYLRMPAGLVTSALSDDVVQVLESIQAEARREALTEAFMVLMEDAILSDHPIGFVDAAGCLLRFRDGEKEQK